MSGISSKPPHKPGYRVEEWEDETSMYDPRGRRCPGPGSDYYVATYRCYVPIRLKSENVESWLDKNYENVVWIGDDGIPVKGNK